MAQSSKFYENCGCFLICTPHKTRTFTVRLAVTTKYQGTVLQQRCCLDATTQESSQSGVIAFPILGTWWDATTKIASQSVHLQASYGISNTFQQRPSAILNFKNFNIWSHDCHCGPNLLLHTEFHQNWFTRSASRRPQLHNVQCALLGNGRRHGNRIIATYDEQRRRRRAVARGRRLPATRESRRHRWSLITVG